MAIYRGIDGINILRKKEPGFSLLEKVVKYKKRENKKLLDLQWRRLADTTLIK